MRPLNLSTILGQDTEKINRFYIGSSANPELRLHYHNSQNKGWTRRGRPWKIVFQKQFPSKSEAMKWERWIKKQKKQSIIVQIINNTFNWNL